MVKLAGRWWGKAAAAKQSVESVVEDETADGDGSRAENNKGNLTEAAKAGGVHGAGDFEKTVEVNKTANVNQAGPDRPAGEKTVADKAGAEKSAVHNAGSDKDVATTNRSGAGSFGAGTASGVISSTAAPLPGAAGVATGGTGKTGIGAPVLAHDKRRALGRGLESLLPGPRPVGGAPVTGATPGAASEAGTPSAIVDGATAVAAVPGVIAELHAQASRKSASAQVVELPIEQIDVNPHQTRSFTQREKDTLQALTDSIKVHGVIQPITVRPLKDGRHVLITGERRMRASTMAGKATIPAIVRVVSEQQAAEMTVIENLQRQDLTCIDLARAYIMLSKDFGLTQEQIGERVGSSRESVSNYMRLVKLPELVQSYLREGQLEFSHARLLLNVRDPETAKKIAYQVVMQQISVDKLEDLVFDHNYPVEGQHKVKRGARWVDPNVKAAQRKMEEVLGVRVKIRDRNNKGKITLEYGSLEDFDRVVGMLTGKVS